MWYGKNKFENRCSKESGEGGNCDFYDSRLCVFSMFWKNIKKPNENRFVGNRTAFMRIDDVRTLGTESDDFLNYHPMTITWMAPRRYRKRVQKSTNFHVCFYQNIIITIVFVWSVDIIEKASVGFTTGFETAWVIKKRKEKRMEQHNNRVVATARMMRVHEYKLKKWCRPDDDRWIRWRLRTVRETTIFVWKLRSL